MRHSAIEKYRFTFLSFIMFALSLSAIAQDAKDIEPEAAKIYQIDIIVFRNANAEKTSTETWQDDAKQANSLTEEKSLSPDDQIHYPVSLDSLVLEPAATTSRYYPSNGLGEPGFLLLDPASITPEFKLITTADDSRGLNSEFAQIRKSNAYVPILYATWRQEIADKKTANSFNVAATAITPDKLSGTVMVYKERFLHLVLNLEMPQSIDFGFQSELSGFRINQSRRLRGSKIQYFDHPKFGVIALVKEVVPPESDETKNQRE